MTGLVLLTLSLIAAPAAQAPKPVDPHYLVPPTKIPKTLAGILDMLRADHRELLALVEGTPKGTLYEAFTRVRDLSLALETRVPQLAPARRARAKIAVRETMRLVWLLHEAADFGQGGHARTAIDELRPAIAELVAAFEPLPSRPPGPGTPAP